MCNYLQDIFIEQRVNMFLQEGNTAVKLADNAWLVRDVIWQSVNNILASMVERLPYIVAGILVFGLFWLLGKIIKAVFWKTSSHTNLDNRLRILFSRLIFLGVVVLGIFTAFTVIIPTFKFGDLIAGLGFTSFVIGFATKDILNNLFSGVLILWQQPFKIGDYIFIGSNQGKVEYIGVRATRLRKDDGEQVLIPNGDMYSSAITIRGAGAERRMLLKISIGYDSDIIKAKELILKVLQGNEGVVEEPKSNVVVTDLTSDGVNLSIYFWINTDQHKPMQVFDTVATNIKEKLGDSGIEMFPPNSVIVQTPNGENITPVITESYKRNNDL